MSVYDPGSRFTYARGFDLSIPHPGIDWWAPTGTPIPAAAAGKVVGLGFRDDYGHLVIIRHTGITEPPHLYTLYAHMEATQAVSLGDEVARGRIIGYVDDTGTGGNNEPHLHFELVSLPDFTWESEWGRYGGKSEATWSHQSVPLMLTSTQGRIDPELETSWIGVDVYFPQRRSSGPRGYDR